jgi:predicted TIM-barrel fold metal-dependent hydrolase
MTPSITDRKQPTFLPDPQPRERLYTVVSVDDHVVEPPWMFENRVEAKYADQAPRVVEDSQGNQAWLYEGEELPNFSVHATVGRAVEEVGFDPQRFDEMRRGCWDIRSRVADMDINGIAASLNFPSKLAGFGGVRFSLSKDKDLGLALMRAYNDWHLEEWAGTCPGRIIPCQVPWLADVAVGAEEIRRNAARGFRSVTFPDDPERLGLPSMHSGHWDPILQACAETETVVSLHVGSASHILKGASDGPVHIGTVLFPLNSMVAAVDWLFSLTPSRIPDLKIMLAESGIGWVPTLLDRLKYCLVENHAGYAGGWQGADDPCDVLLRNFWFSSLEDPAGFALRDRIGIENILVESDYPHPDSTWPNTQAVLHAQLAEIPDAEVAAVTHGNAERLFRFPLADELRSSRPPGAE